MNGSIMIRTITSLPSLLIMFLSFPYEREVGVGASHPCDLREFGRGNLVCVCSASYCDTVDRVSHIKHGEFVTFTSSKDGQRFNKKIGTFKQNMKTKQSFWSQFSTSSTYVTFTIDSKKKYQKIMGFGGAFTDSAGINILTLGPRTQEHLLRSYFSEEGIEYNMGRVPIGGSDFSTHAYSYDHDDYGLPDPHLERFSLSEADTTYKIPLIQRAMRMSPKSIHMVAASWSPPPWMKTNKKYLGYAYLMEDYYATFATYLLRFLDEYKKHNINIWSLSTGNEPTNGVIPILRFNSLGWTPKTMADWIVKYLGPQLRNSVHKDTLLMTFDDQRMFMHWSISTMIKADEKVLKYIDGFAIHWYLDSVSNVEKGNNKLHEKYPGKFLIYSEACSGYVPLFPHVDVGSWKRGEAYLDSIIENMNSWVSGWLDWNLALDMMGGPNWVKNHVDSPILVNALAGEFYKQPMFYAMGHVSKFVERDAMRIEISPKESKGLLATAFENPDGRIVVVMLNKSDRIFEISIEIQETGWIFLKVPARSFTTILC